MTPTWIDLARQSILDPRNTAPILVDVPLDRRVLPMALLLVAVLNGLLYGLILPEGLFPPDLAVPIPMAVAMGVTVLASAGVITLVGQMFGGVGGMEQVLRVTIWLQLLRLAAQAVISLLTILVPGLAWMAALAVGVWGLYMLVCFVAAAHRFDARIKAVGVIGVTFFAAVIGLSVLLSALGIAPVEI